MDQEPNFVYCECEAKINGTSKLHAQKLLSAHKKSKRHKELMEIKSRKEQKKLT